MFRLKRSIPDEDSGRPEGYVGNIWGWKFSFLSLALILLMLTLMLYRYSQLPDNEENIMPVDSTTESTSPKSGNY